MNILNGQEFRVQLSAAVDTVVVCDYTDAPFSNHQPNNSGNTTLLITATTLTSVVTGPAASTVRKLTYGNILNIHASQSVSVTLSRFDGTNTRAICTHTLAPGEYLIYEPNGHGWIKVTPTSTGYGEMIERRLDAAQTGTNGTAAQNWFPTLGAASVEAGCVYEFDGLLNMTRAAGTTSHTTSMLFGGTATLTSILWRVHCNTGDTLANAALNHAAGRSASAVVVKAASTSATEEVSLRVEGSVKINAGGTFIPQFSYSAAPGGAPTIQIGSYFFLLKKGTGFNQRGAWA